MCCCGEPNVNGTLGYRWQPNDAPRIRPVDPPTVDPGDTLLYDEPGRCGGIDSHSHHYRVVKSCATLWLLVKHGAGEERFHLSLYNSQVGILETLDSNARYWMLNALYHAYQTGKEYGQGRENEYWRKAAAEKRIKTRKLPSGGIRVLIEPVIFKETA